MRRPETGHKETYITGQDIGEGMFGVVSIVKRRSDGQVLCCKRADWKSNWKGFKALEAEYKAMRSLSHPNIVQVYDCKKEGQHLYMYMEYCRGGDLYGFIERMKKKGEFATEEFVWKVLSQLLSALYCCHYRTHPPQFGAIIFGSSDPPTATKTYDVPILHRDIKPDNIFLDEFENIKLGDFGLCKRMPANSLTIEKVGSPHYMSPEMLNAFLHRNGKGYAFPADIWALGCTIYELCQGEPPFSGKGIDDLFHSVQNGAFKPLPHFYSPGLEFVISSCLRVEPGHRPSTAALSSLIDVRNHLKMMYGQEEILRKEMEAQLRQAMEAERQEREARLRQEMEAVRQEREARLRQEMEAEQREREARLRQEMEAEQREREARLRQQMEANRQEKDAHIRQELEAHFREELEDRIAQGIDLKIQQHDQMAAPSWRDIQTQRVTELDDGSPQRLTQAVMMPVRTYCSLGTSSESEGLLVFEDKSVKPTVNPEPRPMLIPKHRLSYRIES